jgi:hypothetical protein
MSIIDKLKGIKDQLPKTALDEKVQKENNNLEDQVKAEIKSEENEESNTHPGLGPAKEDYILLNTFTVQFERKDSFIQGDKVFAVKKADYDLTAINKEKQELKITFAVVDAKHYIGRPTEYTNFKTDQEIYDLITQFNQEPPKWMELTEYGDETELPRLTTRFWGLKITKIEFPEYNVQDDSIKYYIATLSYDKKQTHHGEYEEIVE